MKVTRLLHASVNVSDDLDGTRDWYARTLGLESTWRPEIPGVPGEWFAVDTVQLHLVGAPEQRDRSIDPSAHHVCFAVADLDLAVAELEAAGVPYVRGAQNQRGVEVAQVFVTDPVGNVVELQQDQS
jgi:catechol 2,3-dioxygenase-like lactoylglutathione lyase family enzyme